MVVVMVVVVGGRELRGGCLGWLGEGLAHEACCQAIQQEALQGGGQAMWPGRKRVRSKEQHTGKQEVKEQEVKEHFQLSCENDDKGRMELACSQCCVAELSAI
eukprot:755998-Pelagomonas_calceolata.AAC.6